MASVLAAEDPVLVLKGDDVDGGEVDELRGV